MQTVWHKVLCGLYPKMSNRSCRIDGVNIKSNMINLAKTQEVLLVIHCATYCLWRGFLTLPLLVKALNRHPFLIWWIWIVCRGLHFCLGTMIYFPCDPAGKIWGPITVKLCSENIWYVWKPRLHTSENVSCGKDNIVW